MDTRGSVISIIVKEEGASAAVNDLLHEYRQYIMEHLVVELVIIVELQLK